MEPTPPGPRLVATVWADPECTVRPSGEVDTVYLRVEMDIDTYPLDLIMGPSDGDQLTFFGYTDPPEYNCVLWVDYLSELLTRPLQAGDVLTCVSADSYLVDERTMDFYLPS